MMRASGATSEYSAVDPTTGATLPGTFRHASRGEIDAAMTAAVEAFDRVRTFPSTRRADLLERIAQELSSLKGQIVERAAQETGLPADTRLGGELDRACTVLRIFSDAVRRGYVQDVRVTSADPSRLPKPRADVRRMRVGIGPIVVIEASNFPLAFGVMGGDAGSAIAAGCPVVAKAHPFHPGTSELVAQAVQVAVKACGFPPGFFTLLHGGPEETIELVTHPFTRGVGFTGSRAAGMAIREAANKRSRPLDELSLEMGSLNPVFFFPGALASKGPELARAAVEAVLVGGGQFCTKPGHLFVPTGPAGDQFVQTLAAEFRKATGATLLAPQLSARYQQGCAALERLDGVARLACGADAESSAAAAQPLLFEATLSAFMQQQEPRDEVFGPMSVVVRVPESQLLSAASMYEGELTATIHSVDSEADQVAPLAALLGGKVGRLLFAGFSPGVELCDGVNHGGPWPAALGRSTVVGTTSYERWLRPLCLQDMPPALLPPELQPDNPLGLSRRVDGLLERR